MSTHPVPRALHRAVGPPDAAGPQPGDVVIAAAIDRPRHYTLAQHPSTPQVRCTSREAAVDVATRFAQVQSVDVWIRQASSWTRLATCRRHASAAVAAPAAR